MLFCAGCSSSSLGAQGKAETFAGLFVLFRTGGFLHIVARWRRISGGSGIFAGRRPERLEKFNASGDHLHNIFVGYNQLVRLVLSLLIAAPLICGTPGRAGSTEWGLAH